MDGRMTQYTAEWYEAIVIPRGPKLPYKRGDLAAIQYVRDLIRELNSVGFDVQKKETLVVQLRDRLKRATFWDFLNGPLLKASKIVESEGLPRIFEADDDGTFPPDLRDDSAVLYSKWMSGDLDPYLLRGLATKHRRNEAKDKTNISRSFSKNFSHFGNSDAVGAGNLHNGQWWPLQMCANRDGAHGETEAGIHGNERTGAVSIVLSGGSYKDLDEGERIEYHGTPGKEGKASARTRALITSCGTKNPVRVLRTHKLPEANPYRPKAGIRYDGLYTVKSYVVLDKEKATYQFTLRRDPGQSPIRFQGPTARPTSMEIDKWKETRILMGFAVDSV